jgi:hypothetical protein
MVDLNGRVEMLERQVRTLKRLFFGAIAAAIVVAGGAGAFAQVQAQAQQQAMTWTNANGGSVKIDGTGVQMYNSANQRVLLLGFNTSSHPSLYLQDAKGNYRFGAYISDDDQPVIRMGDANDKARIYFGLTAQAHMPRIEFLDASENERLFVGLSTSSTGLLSMSTAGGTTQTQVSDDLINVTDGNGNKRVYLGTSSQGDGIMRLYDSANRERIYAGVYTNGNSGFSAMNAAGQTTWSSP